MKLVFYCDLSYFIIVCLRILMLIINAMLSFSLHRKKKFTIYEHK